MLRHHQVQLSHFHENISNTVFGKTIPNGMEFVPFLICLQHFTGMYVFVTANFHHMHNQDK